jgi:hypothetical protein
MKMPGFNAEDSLNRTSGRYRLKTEQVSGADVELDPAQLLIMPPVRLPNEDGISCKPHNYGCVGNPNYPEDPRPCCHLVRGSDCNERCIAPCECPPPVPMPSCGLCQSDPSSPTRFSQLCCYPPSRPKVDGEPLPSPILCLKRPCYFEYCYCETGTPWGNVLVCCTQHGDVVDCGVRGNC